MTAVVVSDPYGINVSLQLQFNGADGSTSFVDGSGKNKPISTTPPPAPVSTSSLTPKWGAGCLLVNGGGVRTPWASDLLMGTGDFTYEGWSKTPTPTKFIGLVRNRGKNADGSRATFTVGARVFANGSGSIFAECRNTQGGVFFGDVGGGTIVADTWFHWAYVRSGTTFTLYIDGISVGTNTSGLSCDEVGFDLLIGADNPTTPTTSQFDDIRITNGVARYVSNFAPPAEFTAQPLAPPIPTPANGTGAVGAVGAVTSVGVSGVSATNIAGTVLGPGASYFAALAGVSATGAAATVVYLQQRLAVASQTLLQFAQVAHTNGGGAEPIDPNFSAVSLLMHFDHGGGGTSIFEDFSNYHHGFSPTGLANVGSPKFQFGTGAFKRNDGAITASHPTAFNLPGDFTVEGWVYSNSIAGGGPYEFDLFSAFGAVTGVRVFAYVGSYLAAELRDASGAVLAQIGVSTTTLLPDQTWTHWALTRAGTAVKLYLGGTQIGSTVSTAGVIAPVNFASVGRGVTVNDISLIDEVRVTNGLARYAGTSFAPPTAAFPDRGSYPTLSASATQVVDVIAQGAFVFGTAARAVSATQNVDPFTQLALASGPSRVASSSTTFAVTQVAAAITTADRNIVLPGDAFYDDVAYLLHGNSAISSPPYSNHKDSSKNDLLVQSLSSATVASSALAFDGYAIAFAKTSGSSISQFARSLNVLDRTISTTEMRVRFDVLTDRIDGTPVAGSPGSYTFDATLQQTGWFFTAGSGGTHKLGLAGAGGLYAADWTTISAGGSSIFFAPYVLQVRSDTIDAHGTHEVTVGWHHIATTLIAGTLKVYLDGVLDITVYVGTGAAFFDEIFIAGADTTGGFAYKPEHTNLSAIEEMRHTWGTVRYTTDFVPPTSPYAGPRAVGDPFTQNAALTGNGPRQVVAAQTFVFAQAATIFTGGAISAVASQLLPNFSQTAAANGQGLRALGATQQLDAFLQAATVAPRRTFDYAVQPLAAPTQLATATSTRTVAAAQQLVIAQTATAKGASTALAGASAFSFTQTATANSLLTLTQGQIVLPLGQSAQLGRIAQLQASATLPAFTPFATVEAATITASLRGYRVRPEARTFTAT